MMKYIIILTNILLRGLAIKLHRAKCIPGSVIKIDKQEAILCHESFKKACAKK